MKPLFTAVAIILSAACSGQKKENIHINIPFSETISITTDKRISEAAGFSPFKPDSSLFISINPKEMKWLTVKPNQYKLTIESKEQVKRSGDTITILDKAIRFIIVDGVTYEVVRSTEVKKAELIKNQ